MLASSLFGQSVELNEIQQLRTKIEQLEKTIKKQQETIETLKIELDEQKTENTRLRALLRKNGIKTNEEMITEPRDGGQSRFNVSREFTVPLSDGLHGAVNVPLAIGEVLWIGKYYTLYVEAIIDDANMIADLQSSDRKLAQVKSPGRRPQNREAMQIEPKYMNIPAMTMGAEQNPEFPSHPIYHQNIWIKGLATNGLADGSYIKYNGELKITGTKKYGNSTIFLLEPVNRLNKPSRKSPSSRR